jgi:hypothetical protein
MRQFYLTEHAIFLGRILTNHAPTFERTIEKGREAIDLSTGSYISLVLLGRGWRGRRKNSVVELVDRVKGGGHWAIDMDYRH